MLYSQYKESGVRIFRNETEYSDFQMVFLQYLAFYSNLHMAVYMNEVSDLVLDNNIYEDAYTYYSQKSKKKAIKQRDSSLNKPKQKQAGREELAAASSTHIVFSRAKAKAKTKHRR